MVTILHGTRETNKKVIHMRAIRVAIWKFPKIRVPYFGRILRQQVSRFWSLWVPHGF